MLPISADPDWPDWNREKVPKLESSNLKKLPKLEDSSDQKKHQIPEREGYPAFLGNIPENARVSNVLGAVKQLIGPFKPCNLIKINGGTCKIVFENKESRDRLLEQPFEVCRIPITTSKRAIPPGEGQCALYMGGLQQADVKQVLGAIKAAIGEFTAMNRLEVVNGCCMVIFKDPKKLEELLVKGLSVSNVPVFLSKQPFRPPMMGMKRGYGQFGGDHPSSHFTKRPRIDAADIRAWDVRYTGFQEALPDRPFNNVPKLDRTDIEDIQLENKRLKLRVQYLEQQVLMLEEVVAKRR